MVALIPILTSIALRPETQKTALQALAWTVSKLLEYENGAGRRSSDAEYHASVQTMREALEKGDVDEIIDRFNANHDRVAELRVPGNAPSKGG